VGDRELIPSDFQDIGDSDSSREEIIAAIRRLIGDDETVQADAHPATPKAQAEEESLEGEAANQIIDHIAPVLSGDAAETPAAEDEDILDLTLELGGLEIVEDEVAPAIEVAEVTDVLELEEVDQVSGPSGDFGVSLLELLAELSPCTEERLFIVALTRDLRGSEDWSLLELKETLHDFVRQLAEQGLVTIHEQEITIIKRGIEHPVGGGSIGAEASPQAEEVAPEPVVEVTSPLMASEPPATLPMVLGAPEATPPQLPHWASARLDRAYAVLRAGQTLGSTTPPAEPLQFQTAPQPGTIAPEAAEKHTVEPEPISMASPMPSPEVEAETHAATDAVSHAAGLNANLQPAMVEPDRLDPMANAGEILPVETSSLVKALRRKAPGNEFGDLESASEPTKFDWAEQDPQAKSNQVRGWLAENVPRRMKAYVPVEVEVRLSPSISDELVEGSMETGQKETQQIQVARAMSLRLSAPKGGFTIQSQSPETQWAWRNKEKKSEEDLAAWQFTLTPTRRGTNALTLAFSYKEVGPDGVVADGALPDKVLDIVVGINRGKLFARAAVWSFTLVLGAALGVYLQSAGTKKSLDALRIDAVTIEAFNEAGTKANDLYESFYSSAEHYGVKGWNYLKRLWGEADSKQ